MNPGAAALVQGLAVVGILVGFAGIVLPIIPGPALIWLSCLAWAWADSFEALGWPTLAMITVMAVIAQGSDLILGALGARRGGIPLRTLVASSVGSLVGFLAFSLPGALVGAAAALLVVETRRLGGDWRAALASGKTMLAAYILAVGLEVLLSLGMMAIFFYSVLSP